jgi:hypothetical protein
VKDVEHSAPQLWSTLSAQFHCPIYGCAPEKIDHDKALRFQIAVQVRQGCVGRLLGVGTIPGLGVADDVGVAVAVGVGVGVAPDSAQYLPPVFNTMKLLPTK